MEQCGDQEQFLNVQLTERSTKKMIFAVHAYSRTALFFWLLPTTIHKMVYTKFDITSSEMVYVMQVKQIWRNDTPSHDVVAVYILLGRLAYEYVCVCTCVNT